MQVVEIKLKGSKSSHLTFSYRCNDEQAAQVVDQVANAKEGGMTFLVLNDANLHVHVFARSEVREIHIKGQRIE